MSGLYGSGVPERGTPGVVRRTAPAVAFVALALLLVATACSGGGQSSVDGRTDAPAVTAVVYKSPT